MLAVLSRHEADKLLAFCKMSVSKCHREGICVVSLHGAFPAGQIKLLYLRKRWTLQYPSALRRFAAMELGISVTDLIQLENVSQLLGY